MTRLAWLLLLPALPCAGVEIATADFGGTPVPIGAGPRVLGMGGAAVAIADDSAATTVNPAGMTELERPEAGASGGWYWRRTDIDGASVDSDSSLELDHISVIVPFFAFGAQQSIGAGWYREFDFTRAYAFRNAYGDPDDFAVDERVRVEQEGSWSSLGLGWAIEPIPTLSFGVTGKAWADRWTQASHYTERRSIRGETIIFGFPDPLSSDAYRRFEVEEGYSAVLGMRWQVNARWSAGLVVKPDYELDIEMEGNRIGTDGTPIPLSSRSEVTMPASATFGVAWRTSDVATLALDATWTNWSGYHATQGGVARSPINPFIDPGSFDDGWTLRLGYERVFVRPRLVFVARAGAFWERLPGSSPMGDLQDPASTHAQNDDYVGATAGFSVFRRTVLFDVAGQLRYASDVGAGQWSGPDREADVLDGTIRIGVSIQP